MRIWSGFGMNMTPLNGSNKIVVVGGGELMHRGSTKEIFPLIMADTLGSCPVLNK